MNVNLEMKYKPYTWNTKLLQGGNVLTWKGPGHTQESLLAILQKIEKKEIRKRENRGQIIINEHAHTHTRTFNTPLNIG